MRIDCSLPVALSLAPTERMPLASMSKVTSICGHAARRRRDAVEDEAAELAVVRRHLALALEHADLDLRLAVGRRREDLAAPGRDRGVALDQLRHHAAEGLDAERERRHVEQQHVLHVAGEHAALDRRADRHDLVRVHALVAAPCRRTPSPSAAPAGCASSRRPAPPRRSARAASPASARALRQGSRLRSTRSSTSCSNFARVSFRFMCFGPALVRRDEGQIDVGARGRRELDLGLLGRLAQALHRHRILGQVDALVLLELGDR